MMFKFGFELEGFFLENDEVTIPPKNYPTDGFPGLVELRTTGAKFLSDAYAELLTRYIEFPADFQRSEAVFQPKQRAELRRRYEYKSAWDIQNIYGKNPRALGNKTIASLQINVSNEIRSEHTDKDGKYHPSIYGLFDIAKIVKALDDKFRPAIMMAKRQPGEYAVKDNRLEYRSLPNFCFPVDIKGAKFFLDQIEEAVNN